jgi:excisionase family DNA binding protein
MSTGGSTDAPLDSRDSGLPLVLTIREAATALRLGRGSVYELVRQGRIPSVRLGRRIVVPRAALEAMLRQGCERE